MNSGEHIALTRDLLQDVAQNDVGRLAFAGNEQGHTGSTSHGQVATRSPLPAQLLSALAKREKVSRTDVLLCPKRAMLEYPCGASFDEAVRRAGTTSRIPEDHSDQKRSQGSRHSNQEASRGSRRFVQRAHRSSESGTVRCGNRNSHPPCLFAYAETIRTIEDMMQTRSIALALLLLLAVAFISPSAEGGPYDKVVCPITDGQFILEEGRLWFRIFRHGGKPVKKQTEKVANPLDEKSNEALAKRGRVQVAAHPDESGGLFIHWDSLK